MVEHHTNADIGWFFDQWVHASAIPTYRVAHRIEPTGGGQFRVRLRVRQENVPDDFQAFVPVTLDLGKDREARIRVKVKGRSPSSSLRSCRRSPSASSSTIWRGAGGGEDHRVGGLSRSRYLSRDAPDP
jgi:hypothetical protein